MAKRATKPRFRKPDFPAWIERTVHLPLGLSAEPGRIKLPVYLREIAAAMADPAVEKIVVQKSARLGFSTLLNSLIAYHFVEKPAPILLVLPTESLARTSMLMIEDIFAESPALRGRLPNPSLGRSDRNTLLVRKSPDGNGASLRAVAAGAPRNLRMVAAKILLIDEVDSLEDSEGNAVSLATSRTLTYPDRKIVIGGTPLLADTSRVCSAYAESDMHVYECRCPRCHGYVELRWSHFEWPEGRPQEARWRCPLCAGLVDEGEKPKLVQAGRWRALRPDAPPGRRGYRLSCLISNLAHATWRKAAAEFEQARGDDEKMQAFQNEWLGEGFSEIADELDEGALASRVGSFSLDAAPAEALALTCGCDVQDDRIECSILGHGRDGVVFVLGHVIIWGSPLADDTWAEVEALLRQRWKHPHGRHLKIDSAVIDAGDGGHYDAVMAFCNARLARRVLAGKGVAGFARPAIQMSKTKKGRLFIVGVDAIKTQIINRLARGQTIRFSHTLEATYFEQLTSERRIVRMARGRPVARFERKPGARAESLDCLTYGLAAKAALALTEAAFSQREDDLRRPADAPPPAPRPSIIKSAWMESQRVRRDDPGGWR